MKLATIKNVLKAHGLFLWQLYIELGVARSTFNTYEHINFRGHEKAVKRAIVNLIEKNKKGDANND